jgi:ubiquinone/menaquinone biosynthesis C-methylase UbiE
MLTVPRLYTELASWFHLLSRPEDYKEEAQFAHQVLIHAVTPPPRTLLELGAGGGNNASHLKNYFHMTLSDVSEAMLENSRRINPECEHIAGDMRTIRLGRQFDAVFIHDAICYMLTEQDLQAALQTAFEHCRSGGTVLIMPDYTRETFRAGVHHGGHDGERRALRYLEWTFDPDSADNTYTVDFVYMLREGSSPVRVVHDTHLESVFPRTQWLQELLDTGFADAKMIADDWGREVFLALKGGPGSAAG